MTDIAQTLSERRQTHGDFKDHASLTQSTKLMWQNMHGWRALSLSQRETLDMIAHKVGRILAGNPNHKDHWDDIAGYALLISKQIEGAHHEDHVI
jgi:hypothetical protein